MASKKISGLLGALATGLVLIGAGCNSREKSFLGRYCGAGYLGQGEYAVKFKDRNGMDLPRIIYSTRAGCNDINLTHDTGTYFRVFYKSSFWFGNEATRLIKLRNDFLHRDRSIR